MKINIVNYFDELDYSTIINKVLLESSKQFDLSKKTITIILVDNTQIQELNKNYRNKDYPTDVLTFNDGLYNNLGDIFISIDKCKEQSVSYNHSFDRELGFLAVHGLLHTLGYDHLTEEDELEMTSLQEKVLQKVKLFR